jgi:hypothetical protein
MSTQDLRGFLSDTTKEYTCQKFKKYVHTYFSVLVEATILEQEYIRDSDQQTGDERFPFPLIAIKFFGHLTFSWKHI